MGKGRRSRPWPPHAKNMTCYWGFISRPGIEIIPPMGEGDAYNKVYLEQLRELRIQLW